MRRVLALLVLTAAACQPWDELTDQACRRSPRCVATADGDAGNTESAHPNADAGDADAGDADAGE